MQYTYIILELELEYKFFLKKSLVHPCLLYPTHQWKRIIAHCDTDQDILRSRHYFGRLLMTFANRLNPDQDRLILI